MKVFWGLIVFSLKDQLRHGATIILSLLFFTLVCVLIPVGLEPEKKLLISIGPGAISTAAFLATLITVNTLFQRDFEDGVIEQMILSSHGASLYAAAKILAQSLLLILTIIFFLPLMAIFYHLSFAAIIAAAIGLILAIPALVSLGAIGAALTLKAQSPLLTIIIILPFYVPILIFTSMAIANAELQVATNGPYLALFSFLLLDCIVAPVACSAALKINCE